MNRVLLIVLLIASAVHAATADDIAISKVLDDFHDAAAHGDNDRYLGHLADDAVFMGTDEWERWPKHPDFIDYVGSRFNNGSGWSYQAENRVIAFAPGGDIAWFDEVVVSPTNGRFRGTGVLVRQDGDWKIAHYAMSFLVFNEDWQEVVELTRKTRAEKTGN